MTDVCSQPALKGTLGRTPKYLLGETKEALEWFKGKGMVLTTPTLPLSQHKPLNQSSAVSNQIKMFTNRPTSLKRICKIDMTAFAAVLVVLLFLMMIFKTTEHNAFTDLPKVAHPVEMPRALREDAVIIAILRDGKIFFGNDRTTAAEVPAKIEERLIHGAERKVYIQADARASYGTVRIVLGAVRSAGVENVGILVRTTLRETTPD